MSEMVSKRSSGIALFQIEANLSFFAREAGVLLAQKGSLVPVREECFFLISEEGRRFLLHEVE